MSSKLPYALSLVVAAHAALLCACGSGGSDQGAPSEASPSADGGADASGPAGEGGAPGDGGALPDGGGGPRLPIPTFCSQDDWCWSYPPVEGMSIRALSGTSDRDLWLLGEELLHYDGTKLSRFDGLSASFTPTAIAAVSPTEAWVFGTASTSNGVTYLWNGASWSMPRLPVFYQSAREARVVGQTLVLASSKVLAKRGAADWTEEATGLGAPAVAVAGTSDSDVWVASEKRVSHWDGLSWTPADVTGIWIESIDAVPKAGGGSELWLAGRTPIVSNGFAAVARPNGAGWDVTPSTLQNRTFASIRARSATDVWAAGEGGSAHFTGGAWTFEARGALGSIRALHATPTGALYAGGRHGRLKRQESAAASWALLAGQTDTRDFWIDDLWGASASDVWAVGAGYDPDSLGLALHFDGAAWSPAPMPAGAPPRIHAVRGSGATNVWAAADTTLMRFDGAAWSLVAVPGVTRGLYAVHPRAANDVWAFELAQDACRLHHYDGNAWTPTLPYDCDAIARTSDTAIWAASSTEVWVATGHKRVNPGSGNGLVIWNGAAWSFPAIVGRGSAQFFALDANSAWLADTSLRKRNPANGAWSKVSGTPRVDSVHAFADTDVWILDLTSAHRSAAGGAWTRLRVFDSTQYMWLGKTRVWGAAPTDMWVSFRGGLLHRKK